MQEPITDPVPVRTALEDVANSSRTVLLKRLDLFQLEAERLVDDAGTRLSGAAGAAMLASMAMLTGSVALIAWGTPTYGLAGSAGLVTAVYAVMACASGLLAKRRRRTSSTSSTSSKDAS